MFKFFKKVEKEIVLTSSMMIEKASGIVNGAVSMFKIAVDEIDRANDLLNQSKAKSELKIQLLESELSNTYDIKKEAEENIKNNLTLKEKLNQFLI